MNIAGPVTALRAYGRRTWGETCTITRGGTRTFNPATGRYTYSGATTVYTGTCSVWALTAGDVDAGDERHDIGVYNVKVPADTDIAEGDRVTVDSSELDASLIGVHAVVGAVFLTGHQVHRRFEAKEER